jgi:2-phospho-L-lactate guanylyltransferase
MLQLPGDVPLATPEELSLVLSTHRAAPSFTIVPSHDDFGSNAIVVSPPTAVPLTFGEDSFFPHLRTARHFGIEPLIVRMPGIGRDIDNVEDLAIFSRMGSNTRTQSFLDQHGFAEWGRGANASHQAEDAR